MNSTLKPYSITQLILSLVLMAISVSCDVGLPEPIWEGEHVIFASAGNRIPCGSTLERLDRSVAKIKEALGYPLTGGRKITYYWLYEDEVHSICGEKHHGCAAEETIVAMDPIIPHECVHALTSYRYADAHTLFTEGLAMALGEEIHWSAWSYDCGKEMRSNPSSFFVRDADSLNYYCAGVFTQYLIKTYGMKRFLELYGLSKRHYDKDDLSYAMQYALGVSMDDAIAGLNSADDYDYLPQPFCLEEAKVLSATEPTVFTVSLDCRDENVIGWFPTSSNPLQAPDVVEDSRIKTYLTIEVPETDHYLISFETSSSKHISGHLRPCGFSLSDYYYPSLFIPMSPSSSNVYQTIGQLDKGTYQMEITVFSGMDILEDAEKNLTISIETYSSSFFNQTESSKP